jgi:hypothetical protein
MFKTKYIKSHKSLLGSCQYELLSRESPSELAFARIFDAYAWVTCRIRMPFLGMFFGSDFRRTCGKTCCLAVTPPLL